MLRYGHGSWMVAVVALGMLALRSASSRRGGSGRSRTRAPYGSPDAPPTTSGRPATPAEPSSSADQGLARVGIPPGWMVDPSGRYEERYWSGTVWTEHVRTNGVPASDRPPGG
ncbi:MAG TPA: DUF2510 domain-containing protein [Acidimicrobiales bacterium]|nr:DUF2510 domain-containing protein [Acidimicrobiales bacterium]